MEVRANYILVGTFTILGILGILWFTLWVSKSDTRMEMQEFDVAITDSVSGLGLNSDVLFSGIRVGQVADIKISSRTPGEVVVRVAIRSDTPVRENSIASLESRGLTGLSVISISGGTEGSNLIKLKNGQVGTLEYRPSPFAAFKQYVPHTLENMVKVLLRLDEVLSDKNLAAISDSLVAVQTITTTVANRAESLDAILRNTEIASKNIVALTASADNIVSHDLKLASASLNSLVKKLESSLAILEPGLASFSKEGFGNIQMLIVESRNMVNAFSRIAQRLENDPRRFFFGESTQEFRP